MDMTNLTLKLHFTRPSIHPAAEQTAVRYASKPRMGSIRLSQLFQSLQTVFVGTLGTITRILEIANMKSNGQCALIVCRGRFNRRDARKRTCRKWEVIPIYWRLPPNLISTVSSPIALWSP